MKCHHCKKRSHIEFKCHCGHVFCVACRIPECHACVSPHYEPVVLTKVVAPKVDKL